MSSLAAPADTATAAASDSTPCWNGGGTTCASTDPQVTLYATSSGDTSACTFTATIDWGDKTAKTVQNYPGGPDGSTDASFVHDYHAPGTYTIAWSTAVASGNNCGGDSGTLQFTLQTPCQAGGSIPAVPDAATCSGSLAITSPAVDSIIALTDKKYLPTQPTASQRVPADRYLVVKGTAKCAGPVDLTALPGAAKPAAAKVTSGAWSAEVPLPPVNPKDPGPGLAKDTGSFTLTAAGTGCGTTSSTVTLLDLAVSSPGEGTSWAITTAPAMPEFNAKAQVIGDPADFSTLAMAWTLDLRGKYKDRSGWHTYPQTLITGTETGPETPWNPPSNSPIVGGIARLSVSASLPGVLDEPVRSEPRWINIPGRNPLPAAVNEKVVGLDATNAPTIEHLFCWESGGRGVSYPQFNSAANQGEPAFTDIPADWKPNPPVLQPKYGAPPAGIGIAQLDPAQFSGQQWDWTRNVSGGVTMYRQDLAAAGKLRGLEQARLNSELTAAYTLVNKTRKAHHMAPLPVPNPATVPAEPSYAGVAGVTADAITRYNTGVGWNLFYFNYQYIVSANDLSVETVGSLRWIAQDGKWKPSGNVHQAATLTKNPKWNPKYVAIVEGCTPPQ